MTVSDTTKRPSKFWLWLPVRLMIPIAIVIGYAEYPAIREGTSGPCEALAKLVYERTVASPNENGSEVAKRVGGSLLGLKVAHDYPNYPPALVCATLYYDSWAR